MLARTPGMGTAKVERGDHLFSAGKSDGPCRPTHACKHAPYETYSTSTGEVNAPSITPDVLLRPTCDGNSPSYV